MKNILIIISLLIGLSVSINQVYGQGCRPCPELFQLQDSTCTRIRIAKGSNGILVSDSIRACQGSKVTYNISADLNGCSYPGIVYNYTVTNGTLISSSGSQFTIQWGNTSTASVTISYIYSGGAGIQCNGSFTISAVLTMAPVAAFTISPNPACFNNPTTISFNSNASVNAVNYFWDFGDGMQGTGPNPSHNYTAPGTYIVTLIVSSPSGPGGSIDPKPCPPCVDSVKGTVVINALPGPPIECISSVCADETATYCTSATGCSSLIWTVTGGTIISGQNTSCIQVLWGNGNPQGTINLVATGCATTYCPQGTTVTVPIIPPTTTISGTTTVCINATTSYSLPAWPGSTYSWSLSGGGNIINFNTNTSNININWTTPGTWTVTCNYFDSSKNCGGIGTTTVSVLPSANITGNQTFCAGQSTVLSSTNQFNVPVISTWSVTPAGTSFIGSNTGSTVTIGSSTPGTYTVTANPGAATCNVPTYSITVLPQPVLAPITGSDSVCAGQTYVYAVSSNTTGTFSWIVNNGAAVFLGTYNDSVQVTWGNSGPYSLSVSQVSAGNNCLSNTQSFTAYVYPTPIISGATSVCADAVVTYTITNIGNQAFNWYISPASLGTVMSGQGTNQVQIKWHGSTSPGSSNVVYLHYSFCKDDSIAITINEPVQPVITMTGGLCQPGGISLNSNSTGSSFSWTANTNPYTANTSIATGITMPGIYTVIITNYNGTGCTVTATHVVPDIGRPVASISADNVLNYCLPNTPNMNLVAASGAGYSYAWFQSPNIPVGTNSSTLPINTLTSAGSYSYYVIVSLNGCSVTSNIITINIQNCPPVQGCSGAINVTGISGCNPFILTLAATSPAGGTIVNGTTTISYSNAPITSGNTTMTFDSIGYQQIRVCADILLPGGGTTRCCKDTVVLVKLASKFLSNANCSIVTLTDLSNVIAPCTIGTYNWSVGTFPGNAPLLPGVAIFNNNAIANPVLSFTQSGQYIITQTITGCGCTVFSRDTLTISVPNASFTVANSCVGTPVTLNPGFVFPNHFWDFGDAATSYTPSTIHAYSTAGIYTITHTVTDANGCTNTATQNITINPKPSCNISYTGPVSFCAGQQLVLNACAGLTSYQWFNNGIAIGTGNTFTAVQTGNYSFTALNANGCLVISDTVQITVSPAPPSTIISNGIRCLGGTFTMSVPACNTCTYVWADNNVTMPAFTTNQVSFPITAGTIGSHNYSVIVTNTLTNCTDTGNFSFTFYNPPTVSITVAGNPVPLCSNNVYNLSATSNAASPSWAWTFNAINFTISTLPIINASAAGTYNVMVTDGITGCSATTGQVIQASPDLSLFPTGCDTLCDTSTVFLPLPSNNGNLTGYTITWYNNAPPFTNVVGSGPSINLSGLPLGNNNLSVIVISPNGCADTTGNYSIFVKPCKDLPCSCIKSAWDSLYWQPVHDVGRTEVQNANIIIDPPVATNIVCGKAIGIFDCKSPITIFASYACQPSGCDSAVTYQLTGPVTATGVMPFSTTGLPSGSYVLIITGKCGDSVCMVCKIPFIIKCEEPIDCCKESYWKDGPYWNNTATNAKILINCSGNNPMFTIDAASKNCYAPTIIQGTWICPDTCMSNVVYELYDASNTLILTSTGSLTIPTSLANGIYSVKILAYCGGKLCNTCIFKFKKDCKCDCVPEKPVHLEIITNEVSKKYSCGEKLPDISCLDNVVFNGIYNCTPGTCPSVFTYQLTGPSGTTTGNLPLSVSSLAPGNYSIIIYAYCNGKLCKECKFIFSVKCDGQPPKCCPYKIDVTAGSALYSVAKPDSNATIASQTFTISGLTGVPLTEVRAEVVSYNLSSNFNNECLNCTSLPFTWASIASADNIGGLPPKIGLYGGATTPNFVATGTEVYKNPREVVWNSSTPFTLTAPIGIKFYLPPLPVIDCCVLKGTICVKFTFRDEKCRECSATVCFNFEVIKSADLIYVYK
jgi:PKD repeat protein